MSETTAPETMGDMCFKPTLQVYGAVLYTFLLLFYWGIVIFSIPGVLIYAYRKLKTKEVKK